MVKGGDSHSEVMSLNPSTVDGIFTLISCKYCNVCVKKTEKNEKEAGDGPCLFKKVLEAFVYEGTIFKAKSIRRYL